ncbi:hypothetical protein [uncultured Bacteroides sp.]|uniref:hypothetical protein n=1 Tax=uncultured Bacteroides sp. TaxID=162156 RepID=UPI0025FAF5DD|nr:hypothetical protein [uncultured Bacteroides sp.]
MKAETWITNFGGETQTHCQLVIEEIRITKASDIKKAKALTDDNQHNEVRKIALKYTKNELFKQMVERIDELDYKDEITSEELAEHQALIGFSYHFRVLF